ncbi:MAG: AEC family transporter, partial [bacterium]|nr:AEC family transporter [bacterium]
SNYAIVGFSIVLNMFGSNALSLAAILLAFIMPVYNVLAVVALTAPLNRERHLGALKTLFMIIKNPLILALMVALPFSLSRVNVPEALSVAVTYLAKMTLPLALIGIGGSLNFASVKKDWRLALVATILRLIVFPAALTYGAICLGYRGESLGVIFVLFATPTAIASFIMAKAMNSNAELAGNIVLLTTLGSVVTMSLGIFIIRTLGYF